jgi:hypothetical protein
MHFFDSGSFSLWTRAEQYAKANNCGEWEFYETKEFFDYLTAYAEFVKKHKIAVDYCANVDVLPFRGKGVPPVGRDSYSLSYKHLKLLEGMGVSPVPVVHYPGIPENPQSMSNRRVIDTWLRRYMEEGYGFIGLGGIVGSIAKRTCNDFISKAFDMVCPNGTPLVKIHGFGVTSYDALVRYPWYSVDSTSWLQKGGFGFIYVPRRRHGDWAYLPDKRDDIDAIDETTPWSVIVSEDGRKIQGMFNYFLMGPNEQKIIHEWLDLVGVPLGNLGMSDGVISHHSYRRINNLYFFEKLRHTLQKRDWKLPSKGFFSIPPAKYPGHLKGPNPPDSDCLVLFYSGHADMPSSPEIVIGREACTMLTFIDMQKKPTKRFRYTKKARKNVNQSHKISTKS